MTVSQRRVHATGSRIERHVGPQDDGTFQVSIHDVSIVQPFEVGSLERGYSRIVGNATFLEGLFDKAVTMYDHFNDVTNLANRLEDRERQRRLWVMGGGMVERFLEGN